MRYFKKIVGERLYLSPINPDDYEIYTKWLNDPAVVGYLGFRAGVNLSNERVELEKMAAEGNVFAIVRTADDMLIGNVDLHNIDQRSRRAELGIYIGEAENRSQGYGAEAIRLLLKYGFDTLNLHNIDLTAHSDNERGIACYKKVGFREYGRRREAAFKNGNYCDIVHMDILENEFRESYGK